MEYLATALAELTEPELERISALFDAMIDGVPSGLSAWMRHLIDRERDARAGVHYTLRPPHDAIDSSEIDATIVAALRLRLAAIDPPLARLLDAAVPVLTKVARDAR
jgi:hypothetical protein